MGLDQYGFPVIAVSNTILVEQDKYADSAKDLEEAWLEWLSYYPFDGPVAARLSALMRERLARTDREKDGARRQVLERKLELVSLRAERYRLDDFSVGR